MMFRTSVSCLVAIFYSYTALAQESSVTLTAKKDPNGKKNFQDEASFSSPMKTNIPIMMDIISGNSGSHPAMLEFFDSALATVTSCKYQGLSGNEQAKLGKKYRLDSCTNGYLSNAVVSFNRVKLSVENGGVTTVTLSISPAVKDTVFLRMCKDPDTPAKARHTIDEILKIAKTQDCSTANAWVLARKVLNLGPTRKLQGLSTVNNRTAVGMINVSRDIEDVTPLSDFTHIEHLCIDDNKISDISSIRSLINLRFLMAGDNRFQSYDFINNYPNLEAVDVFGNPGKNYDPCIKPGKVLCEGSIKRCP